VDVGIAEDGDEVGEREVEHAEPVHHRVGVGERAQEQHGDRVEHEEGEDDEQRRRPQPAGDRAKSRRALDLCNRRGQCSGFCRHALPPEAVIVVFPWVAQRPRGEQRRR
jgi:hypothetical protein